MTMGDKTPMDLVLHVEGKVTESNFNVFRDLVMEKIDSVNLTPETDEEFAEAETTVKVFSEIEKSIDEAREKALNDTADIRELFESMTAVADRVREVRLDLSKKIKQQKEKKKNSIIKDAVANIEQHISGLYENYPFIPAGTFHIVPAQLADSGKGKKKIETFTAAVDAKSKEIMAEFSAVAARCAENYALIKEVGNDSLFPDINTLIKLPNEEVMAKIEARVAKFKLQEKEKAMAVDRTANDQGRKEDFSQAGKMVQSLAGTTVSEQDMINDDMSSMMKQADVSATEYLTMTVMFGGDIEKIKDIAREVDSIVSRYPEVLSIELTRTKMA